MRHRAGIIAAAIMAAAAVGSAFARDSAIPLLGWGGFPYKEATEARYAEARDCGLTHMMQGVPGTNEALRVLDMAERAGIKLMLNSPQLRKFPEAFAAAVKKHPAFAIYYVKDEPRVDEMDALGEICRRIKAADPGHPCYVNWFGRVHRTPRKWYGTDTFEEYVEASLNKIDLPFMSFDQYPVMNPGNFTGTVFRPPTGPCHIATNWYHALETVYKCSVERQKPFWAFALVSALRHPPRDDYPIALPSHIRLQQYSNLAYGAQGLQYYYYGLTPKNSKHLEQWAPVAPDGRLDSLHDRMREVNLELAARSFVFAGAKAIKVRHTGADIPLGTTRLEKGDLPAFVRSLETPDGGAVVSVLENGGRSARYLVVVNRSPDQELTLRLDLAPGTRRVRTDGTVVDAGRYTKEYWLDGGAAEIFMEGPASGAGCDTASFTVGCVNCGAFHYGDGRASAEDFAAAWRRMAAEWPQDVFFYEDVGRTRKPGDTAAPGLDIRAATQRRPLACDIVELPRSIESEAGEQKSPRYRALRLVYDIGGKKVAVYGVHLVAEGHLRGPKPAKGELSLSQKLRQRQFKALMEDARKFDHAILTGDFNAQKPHEYDLFTDAGYSIANCSPRYGVKATLRNIPADNIIISSGLSFADFKVLDGYVLDTDHRPLVAKVLFTPPKPLPTVAEFLEKPADERRALFKNPEFRLKMVKSNYPDGPGLLSRWVRVENIPNLRDVGGIVNKTGQELRRGVFYRSAGWNDNAKFDKKKPESEWKKGKCRLTDAGRKIALEQMRLKTDLDLRSDPECWGMTGSPIGGGVVWRHVSFGNYDDFEKNQKWRDAVKEAFITLANPESRPLVFHCIGGADRTGSLAYFIQAICDVDDETLLKDWELTCCYTERPQFMHDVCIDKMIAMLAKYQGKTTAERVRSFLRSCGVTDAEMDSVRDALLGGVAAAAKGSPEVGAVKIGVISDTHVKGPESAPELERALKFFADRGVDAVVHCGDVTDLGYLSQLEVFVSSWKRIMPPSTPLIAAFGNRDLSDTSSMTAERKKRDKDLLILSDPGAAMKQLCGWSAKTGVRSLTVRGIPVVAADWKKEGGLESFMSLRPDLRRAAVRGLVTVQHLHPQGTVFGAGAGSWMADDGRATCYLKMYPRACTFSGHSHLPFTTPRSVWRGDFTSIAAGSFYLGPPTASGGREVSVLTIWGDRMELERRDLKTGFSDTTTVRHEDGVRATSRRDAKDGFVFAQWNIGHFAFGKSDTDIAAGEAAKRAAAYRKAIAEIGADFMGVCEFSPSFDKGGGSARDLVFGSLHSFEVGPHRGYQCNALAAASAPLSNVSVKDYAKRCQPTYRIACETQIGGRRAVIVETHLDLSIAERKAQIDALVAEFGAEERIIISGDFNVDDPGEYRPFLAAGFEAANCGRFGALNTHRRRRTAITPAIDNVFVKGFAVRDVRTADDALELSDHRLLVCTLSERVVEIGNGQ